MDTSIAIIVASPRGVVRFSAIGGDNQSINLDMNSYVPHLILVDINHRLSIILEFWSHGRNIWEKLGKFRDCWWLDVARSATGWVLSKWKKGAMISTEKAFSFLSLFGIEQREHKYSPNVSPKQTSTWIK